MRKVLYKVFVLTVCLISSFNLLGQETAIKAAFTVNPENNSIVSELREIVITFTEYEEIVVNEPNMVNGSNISMIYMVDELTGISMPIGYLFTRAGEEANQLVLYFDPKYTGYDVITNNGDYKISVSANVVKFGDDINAAFDLYYTIDNSVSINTPMENGCIKAYGYKGDVVVNGCEQGECIEIYNIEGVLLRTVLATSSIERIAVPSGGIYIVKVANNAVKVTL